MVTLQQIRADLREIRFYYINKETMDEAFQTTGQNEIMSLVEKSSLALPILLTFFQMMKYLLHSMEEKLWSHSILTFL